MRPASTRGFLFSIVAVIAAQCLLWGQAKGPEVSVPFVGCKSDGQAGPVDAPNGASTFVAVTPPAAKELAYYSAGELGVLAPRGWHCFKVYGSSGATLIVTPDPFPAVGTRPFAAFDKGLRGSAIEVDFATGSGRDTVAGIVARVFPAYRSFAEDVAQLFDRPANYFSTAPFPHDQLRYLSNSVVEFRTSPRSAGLGIYFTLRPSNEPIHGVAILEKKDGDYGIFDLLRVSVRLPNNLAKLVPSIIQQIESDAARPDKKRP